MMDRHCNTTCCLYTTVSLEFIFMTSTFFRHAEADVVIIVMGFESERVLVVDEFIRRLNHEVWDREQDGRVSGDIPTNSNPVKWCVQTVICPSLEGHNGNAQKSENTVTSEEDDFII
jgi:hypothetical protein